MNKTTYNEQKVSFEVFVNNTNVTFLSFLYKISIEVSIKIKVASRGN